MQSKLSTQEAEKPPFFKIAEDITQLLILFLAVRGHGKSSSLRTVIKYIRQKRPDIVFKIFDVSQAWYHNAPVEARQMVTPQNWRSTQNVDNCVYEMGSLPEFLRRVFVASIVAQDYKLRYDIKKENGGKIDELPWVVYVFEEANVYFGSYSFRKNDDFSPILQDFVSVGRNYKMSAFLVATAEQGEISPSLRRRVSRLYGRMESVSDLNALRRKDKGASVIVRHLPKYHFLYYSGKSFGPFRIRDEVNQVPQDYVGEPVKLKEVYQRPLGLSWWVQFFIGSAIAMGIFWLSRRT
jgi:hypothetical protein